MKIIAPSRFVAAVVFAVSAFLLLGDVSLAQQFREQWKQLRQSDVMQRLQKNSAKQVTRSMWNGKGSNLMAGGLAFVPELREAFGITEEQSQKLGIGGMMEMQNDPVFQEYVAEMQKSQTPDDPFLLKASEEQKQQFLQTQEKFMGYMFDKMSENIDNTLTPEQKVKFQEYQIASMGDQPVVSPDMFEALGLSDSQRGSLDLIRKELESEFEKNMEEMVDYQMEMMDKLLDYLDDDIDISSSGDQEDLQKQVEEMQKKMLDARKKLNTEHPEYKKREDELTAKGKAFANKLKFKMFDVLTDEQMERMAQLIDNPPEDIKKAMKKIKEMQGEQEKAAGYQPNLDSWKPGEPIPDEYLEQRKERKKSFPKKQ